MMKQEYIVLPKQNEWLKDLIGKSLNQKLISEAAKKLFINHKLETGSSGFAKAIVTVSDTKTKEILGIGGSSILENIKTGKKIADLTMDNFMKLLAGLMRPVTTSNQSFGMQDETDTVRSLRSYGANSPGFVDVFNSGLFGAGRGMEMQVGAGTSAPARTDFNIETTLGSAPENAQNQVTVNGLYDQPSGLATSSTAVVATGSGTINESAFWGRWVTSGAAPRDFIVFHDSISPGVAYIAVQTITTTYTLEIPS